MKIIFVPQARMQFLRAISYIFKDNPAAAHTFRRKAERILQRLKSFPFSGGSIPEFPDLPHREVIVPPYRFFYRVAGRTVWIVAVWHGAQEPENPEY